MSDVFVQCWEISETGRQCVLASGHRNYQVDHNYGPPPRTDERCSCGNDFDGDNLCMVSACQWEGIDTPRTNERAGLGETPDVITIDEVHYLPGTTGYELAQEIIRLQRWKAEALPVLDGLHELGKALDLPLGTRITGPPALAAVEALVAERDAAVARVAAVEALVSDWQANGNSRELGDPTDRVWFECARQLLTALAAPVSADLSDQPESESEST